MQFRFSEGRVLSTQIVNIEAGIMGYQWSAAFEGARQSQWLNTLGSSIRAGFITTYFPATEVRISNESNM